LKYGFECIKRGAAIEWLDVGYDPVRGEAQLTGFAVVLWRLYLREELVIPRGSGRWLFCLPCRGLDPWLDQAVVIDG